MDMANYFILTAITFLESGKTTKLMVMVFLHKKKVLGMKADGKMMYRMDSEKNIGLMVVFSKGILKMVKRMEKAN